uniref:Ubiquitinconjugating enzyme E2 putative n=1 Tax=Albugo laibachii Nc14 TaxID=890382 RepID=F0WJH5_9STRA|nr:ubiquitinconjugating enzyme E2 putative [Albugo laibachii Nc14]|eukprot:CCA21424.1 ubiquitinconjugating enzyme E2 putative [Albugo laibachii Nc14]
MSASIGVFSSQTIRRISNEIRQLVSNTTDCIRYVPSDGPLNTINLEIKGPDTTPYEKAFFMVKMVLSEQFPETPPKAFFDTKIYHPNIAPSNGEVCVNTLKKDWSPKVRILHIAQVIRCLLIVPSPDSALNDEAGRLFMESYEEYAERAKIMTKIHAPKCSIVSHSEPQREPDREIGKLEGKRGLQGFEATECQVAEGAKKQRTEETKSFFSSTERPTQTTRLKMLKKKALKRL